MEISLSTLLTSSVVAAIVSGVVSFMQFERGNSIKHITGERSAWRIEMKTAIVNLRKAFAEDPNSFEVEEALACIETRLNPYGKHSREVVLTDFKRVEDLTRQASEETLYFFRDGHVWRAFEKFKSERSTSSLDDLIDYLTMLLKYDWERSKSEILANKYWVLSIIISCIGCWSYLQLSPGSEIGVGIVIYSGSIFFTLLLAYAPQNNKSKMKDRLYTFAGVACWVFSFLLLFHSMGFKISDTYGLLAIYSFFGVMVFSCLAILIGKWGRDNEYLKALYRKANLAKDGSKDNIVEENNK